MSQSEEQRILLASIRTERDAMYFYLRAARTARDGRARRVFERLASDERQHLEWFLDTYCGGEIPDLEAYLRQGREERNSWLEDLAAGGAEDGDDIVALSLALHKEEQLEQHLRRQAASLVDPQLRRVFEVNADSTHQHYLAIRAELERLKEQPTPPTDRQL